MKYLLILIFSLLKIRQCLLEIANYQRCVDFENNGWQARQFSLDQILLNVCNNDTNKELFGDFNQFNPSISVNNIFLNLPKHENIFIDLNVSCSLSRYYQFPFFSWQLSVDGQSTNDLNYSRSMIFSISQPHNSLSVIIQIFSSCIKWGISNFTLKVDKYKHSLSFFIGEENYLSTSDISNNEGWLNLNSVVTQIQQFQTFSVLGSNQLDEFYFEKLFILPTVCNIIEIQLKIFCKSTIEIEFILDYQSITFSQYFTWLPYSSIYLLGINLITTIKPSQFLVIQTRSQSVIEIIGLRDFQLSYRFEKIQSKFIPGCLNQIEDECWKCQGGWDLINQLKICIPTCGDMIITFNEECDDGNTIPYDGCYNCKFSCDLQCQNCQFGRCLDITNYIGLGIEKLLRKLLCGDGIIQQTEQCDDGNDLPYDGCNLCQFQCTLNCGNCINGICLQCNDGLKLSHNKCENICEFEISYNNGNQIHYGECNNFSNSRLGFYDIHDHISLNSYYSDSKFQTCQSICGDGIIQLNEQCDDENDLPYDGNYLCQYQCTLNCGNCKNGICLSCQKGYKLKQNKCESYCGDQIITQDEECDDGNQIQLDGCYNCKFSCSHGCLYCKQNNYCIQCLDGWNLNYGKCYQICNDNQLAILSIEECDDEFDYYCQNCKALCAIDNCIECQDTYTCVSCEQPYSLINEVCVPFCGDGMVYSINEQCDDGNNLKNDGCYNCQFECLEGCLKCDQNQYCILCDTDIHYNYILDKGKCLKQVVPFNEEDEQKDEVQQTPEVSIICNQNELLINFECVNQCGNGVVDEEYENCDDGNVKGGDGCSFDCQVEKFYTCKNNDNEISQCTYIPQPYFILTNLSAKKSSLQIIQITFNEKVKEFNQQLIENILLLSIIPTVQANLTIVSITNLSLTPVNASYLIKIQFLQQVEQPQLKVQIMQSTISSEQGQQLLELNKEISLGEPFILSKQVQLKVEQITQVNDNIIYSMIGIAGVAILSGNFALLLNLLDLLQQLSYIQYMQYQFPSHLKQFLDTYTKISLKPLLLFDKLKIDELIAKLNGGTIPFIGSYKMNKQNIQINQLNQFYLLNAKSCYLSLMLSYGTYLLCCFIVSDNFQKFITNKILLNRCFPITRMTKIYNINQFIRGKCFAIKTNYFYTGIFSSYFAIMHQLLFSAFLQFPNYTFDSWLDICNSINAIISLILITYITFITFSIPMKLNKKVYKLQYFFGNQKYNLYYYPYNQCYFFAIFLNINHLNKNQINQNFFKRINVIFAHSFTSCLQFLIKS